MQILEDAAFHGVKAIQFTGGGEPTVHKDHLAIFSKALDLGMQASLVTNGALLRDGWDDVLPRMDWVRVSIDAGTKETYSEVRGVSESTFEKVLNNIRHMDNAGVGNLGVSFIVTKKNFNEISKAAEIAKSLGVKYIRFGAFYNPDWSAYYTTPMLQIIESELDNADYILNSSETQLIEMFRKRVDYMGYRPRHEFCGYQFLNMYIGGDLGIYRCCELAYNDRGKVGDLTNMSLSEWLYSENPHRQNFDATGCPTCPFHTKNELIEFVTRPIIEELHPNFP